MRLVAHRTLLVAAASLAAATAFVACGAFDSAGSSSGGSDDASATEASGGDAAAPGADAQADGGDDAQADGGKSDGGDAGGCDGGLACGRLVFVTSTQSNGALGGVNGADVRCQQAAAGNPNLAGRTWRAWIGSGSSYSPAQNFPQGTGTYRLVDGKTVIAANWTELVSSGPRVKINLTELGSTLGDAVAVWTGTQSDGAGVAANCTAWTAATGTGKVGVVSSGGTGWTDTTDRDCGLSAHLYCFEE